MSDFKSRLTVLNLNLRFLHLVHVSMAWPLIDIFHEALQYIILALRFTFNLPYSHNQAPFPDRQEQDLLCCLGHFSPIPWGRKTSLSCGWSIFRMCQRVLNSIVVTSSIHLKPTPATVSLNFTSLNERVQNLGLHRGLWMRSGGFSEGLWGIQELDVLVLPSCLSVRTTLAI